MDKWTVAEEAYKNGYEKGFQDGIKKFIDRLTDVADLMSFYSYFDQKWVISQEQIDNISKELTERKED